MRVTPVVTRLSDVGSGSPNRGAAALIARVQFDDLVKRARMLLADGKALCETPAGSYLKANAEWFEMCLDGVVDVLQSVRPHALCAPCAGQGCEGCQGSGFVCRPEKD